MRRVELNSDWKMKKILKKIIWVRKSYFFYSFLKENKYLPNFRKPKTYNEKINFRKSSWNNPLFITCADKIAVKKYVADITGKQYIIPTLYEADSISLDIVKGILTKHGDCLLKANHNSGPVYLLSNSMTESELQSACDDVNDQLSIDFGKYQNEPWYSQIEPQILIEKRIFPEPGENDLKDYKFHIFRQNDGSQKVILHIDFDRSSNHNRSFFDDELNWLPFAMKYPCIRTHVTKPQNYDEMLKIAKKLAEPFSYVRVDFYNVNGNIYFGELTFAHGGGRESFTSKAHDLWMGQLWQGNPAT